MHQNLGKMMASRHGAWANWGLEELLGVQSGLRIRPKNGVDLRLAGKFSFRASAKDREEIADSYAIEICVWNGFPRRLPMVRETTGRIPRDFHTHKDGSLCLGAPLDLRWRLGRTPTLWAFAKSCLVPYLYGFSYRERHGKLPFGDLDHGDESVVAAYMNILRVNSPVACVELLRLASLQRRKANRQDCPCRSGLRVGRCHHKRLNSLRDRCGRLGIRDEYERLQNGR